MCWQTFHPRCSRRIETELELELELKLLLKLKPILRRNWAENLTKAKHLLNVINWIDMMIRQGSSSWRNVKEKFSTRKSRWFGIVEFLNIWVGAKQNKQSHCTMQQHQVRSLVLVVGVPEITTFNQISRECSLWFASWLQRSCTPLCDAYFEMLDSGEDFRNVFWRLIVNVLNNNIWPANLGAFV